MKVKNMKSPRGTVVANQFIIEDDSGGKWLQSYNSTIAYIQRNDDYTRTTYLDREKWNYSRTTMKYLCMFLGVYGKKEIQKGIDSGKYTLTNLN